MSDLISRQDAIDACRSVADNFDRPTDQQIGAEYCLDLIKEIPSAEPERTAMVWKPAKGRPAYEKGICNCGYVLSVLQRDFVYCPSCGARLEWGE